MTHLAEVAHLLTHEHLRQKPEGGYAKEPALLDILRDSVASTMTSKAGGGGNGERAAPIDLGALDLWQHIVGVIDQGWPHEGNPAYIRVPVATKLTAWVNTTLDPVTEGWLLETCQTWVDRIYELLEPTKQVPLNGVTCPVCQWAKYPVEQDGEWVYQPTLVAFPEQEPVRVACQYPSCSGEWAGPEVAETFFK